MIYLASPYTHELASIRFQRYRAALAYTILAMQKGETIFSPIVYGQPFAEIDPGLVPFERWQTFNESIMLICTEFRILKLEGWQTSCGIRAEIDFAERNFIEVTTVEPLL